MKYRFQCSPNALSQKSKPSYRIQEKEKGIKLLDEQDNPCRSKFARDRDRIVFSKSYRRLIHKTQLYLPEHDEHRRTRLTHTLEVVQIARAISRNLGMNEELAEAIAFGHDIGHAPFGHAGERQIDSLLKGEPLPNRLARRVAIDDGRKEGDTDFEGDFKHNYQSVRVLTFLERYHPDYDGFNLTVQTLEGILKHSRISPLNKNKKDFIFPGKDDGVFRFLDLEKPFSVTVEGQIVALSDEIAQIVHDLDDALRKHVITIDTLGDAVNCILERDSMRDIRGKCKESKMIIAQLRAALLSHFIYTAIDQFEKALKAAKFRKIKGNIKLDGLLLKKKDSQDPSKFELNDNAYRELRDRRDEIILNQFDINRMDSKGQYLIRQLHDAYLTNPLQLPNPVLCQYYTCKKDKLKQEPDKLKSWFKSKTKKYNITTGLDDDDVTLLMKRIEEASDGHDFRRLGRELVYKWQPYMAVDGDFLRCLADHIANMTDVYAHEEVLKLFGKGACQ